MSFAPVLRRFGSVPSNMREVWMAAKIFINYRRDDAGPSAARLRDRLVVEFGAANVFFDVENLVAGQRFDQALEKALAETNVFLAVVGKRWMENLSSRQGSGEFDFVRHEIALALAHGAHVIPVLIDGATLPRDSELSPDVAPLVLRQAHEIRHQQFGRDVEGLLETIRPILGRPSIRPVAQSNFLASRRIRIGIVATALWAMLGWAYGDYVNASSRSLNLQVALNVCSGNPKLWLPMTGEKDCLDHAINYSKKKAIEGFDARPIMSSVPIVLGWSIAMIASWISGGRRRL